MRKCARDVPKRTLREEKLVMPRQSAAALSVVQTNVISSIRRPSPPADLTDEQAEVWRGVVDRLPADWFHAENLPLLVQYCRHVIRARHIAEVIDDAASRISPFDYAKLLQIEEVQSRAISSLATRMRFTQHSSYDKKKAKPEQIEETPWSGSGRN